MVALAGFLVACGDGSTGGVDASADLTITCLAGQQLCGTLCADTASDARNCGGCGKKCDPGYACVAGACALSCADGQAACGKACVTLSSDRDHCGDCGTACPMGNVCVMGKCALACQQGFDVCAGACTNLQSDAANCGACAMACGAAQACDKGKCVDDCAMGQANCAGACANLQTDNANCGACATLCPAGTVCSAGKCLAGCQMPLITCNNMMSCVDPRFDPANCGGCGKACALANAVVDCRAGTCGVASCNGGFGDCNGNAGDGCEVKLTTDVANCGRCGINCVIPNGAPKCSGGQCAVGTCNQGFDDCNANVADGCETKLLTDSLNCGKCGTFCLGSCINGLCFSTKCSNGSFSDCNVQGSTLIGGSAFVDQKPPIGWTQCAGFINTAGDDVAANFLDNCLSTPRLRLRVYTALDVLEEEFFVQNLNMQVAWPNFTSLGGAPMSVTRTNWGITTFFTTTDGRDSCAKQAAPSGTTLGSSDANAAIIAGGNIDGNEYRLSCGGMALVGRKIALYK